MMDDCVGQVKDGRLFINGEAQDEEGFIAEGPEYIWGPSRVPDVSGSCLSVCLSVCVCVCVCVVVFWGGEGGERVW
jgi:hypothetical protein